LRSYLRDREIFGERWTRDQFYADPIGRTSYPLEFLASLFSADLSAIDSGAIRCPVVVIAATGDPLFPVAYMRRVHERIRAPHKEWLEFPLERHLILNECLPEVLPGLLEALRRYAKPPA
jgi:pimeloyl-ACP methyl ester carboxylesterase